MHIGTPLSATALRIMLLGGGELGKEVVIALQRLGVEVIVVDRYANTPAMQVAHRCHVIDMTNAHLLHDIIYQEKPHLIIPEIEAIATSVLLDIQQQQIARVIPTARAVNLTMNRAGIRRLAHEELGLPTSKYRFAHSPTELKDAINQHIGYPCFVKPVMSSSGKGQSLVQSAVDVTKAWEYALKAGRVSNLEVIVEQSIAFDYEITLLTVRAAAAGIATDACTVPQAIDTHFCNPIGHVQINGDYVESWQPHEMSDKALFAAQHIAKTITDNLGGCGIFGVELFVKGDQVWFSEVSPRPHDTGMVTMVTKYQDEFELHARAILGLPVNVQQHAIGASHVIYAGRDAKALVYSNLEQALSVPNSQLRLFGKPEGFVKRRMGVALSRATDIATARNNAKLVASLLQVGL